jgi:hypothetical protein
METMLVRLKPFDPRRGHVLRRYTYRGIKFHVERGWYRVEPAVAAYLKEVRQVAADEHAPLAFDVQTEEEARALDAREEVEAKVRRSAAEATRVAVARPDPGALTSAALAEAGTEAVAGEPRRRGRARG